MSFPPADADAELDAEDSARAKVSAIFRELAGDRSEPFCTGLSNEPIASTMAAVLQRESGFAENRAREIAFHLTDWHTDAAFIAAFYLYPERFTPAEVEARVWALLYHAPNHLAAAAALFGHPVADIFEVGAVTTPGKIDEPGTV